MRLCAISICVLILPLHLFCQEREVSFQVEAGGAISAKPFWLHSGTRGKISPDTYLWGNFGAFSDFSKTDTRAFDFALGAEGTGSLGKDKNRLFVNQLFGKIRWQNLTLNVGLWNQPTQYDGLSASNGNILYSNNTRNMPGISIATWDYIRFPWFLGKWLAFKFDYSEYVMLDDRHVKHAHVHHKMLGGKITIIPQLSIEGGIEDFAQWGGKTDEGKIRYNLKDYLKMVCIESGGENASRSDQINKLGNHIGNHFIRINYQGTRFAATLFYNHLFEDGSGMRYQNWPDGLYGIYFTRKDKSKWFKSVVYELYYTKSQSGPRHDRPATDEEIAQKDPNDPFQDRIVLGGNDNYLNHGEYSSGWSLYGQMIGAPFFTPREAVDGIISGTYNNRFIAHHLGICGELPLWNIRYKIMCSYSLNYGTHSVPFRDAQGNAITRRQASAALELILPENKLPFTTTLHLGADRGSLLPHRFGAMLTISKTGIF